MYGLAIIEIMRPIKMSINVSRVFAFPAEEFLLKRPRQYECIPGVMEVMSLAAEQWCISVNLIAVCPPILENYGALRIVSRCSHCIRFSCIGDREIYKFTIIH